MLAGNSIGKEFVVTSFGESHGKCVGVVIDGCPAGLPLSEEDIQIELDKRIPPKPQIISKRVEKDKVEILSGVFKGFTTGAPVCLVVENREADSTDYETIKDLPRPGHVDYPARIRYGNFNDYRGGGRFSGRVTVALIMAGAIAKKILKAVNVDVLAYTKAIGNVNMDQPLSIEKIREQRYQTAVRCPDLECAEAMEEAIIKAKEEGDSLGGIIECFALNVQAGVGDPLFDALDADLAKILLAVPAVKGVEFGAGFRVATLKGSENNDSYRIHQGKVETLTNHAGGILGGLSSGMPIIVRVAVKPTSSIAKEQRTINLRRMKNAKIEVKGRHDPCVVPKAVPVVESAIAIVLVDHMIRGGFAKKVFKESN